MLSHSTLAAGSLDASLSIRLNSSFDHARRRIRVAPFISPVAPQYNSVAMEDLEDELDLRYHKGLNPDVYYRCPTLEVMTPFQRERDIAKI